MSHPDTDSPAVLPCDDDWDESEPAAIEDLSSDTLEGMAARLRTSTRTFVDRVNRESELDALWTLADLASSYVARPSSTGSLLPPRPELLGATSGDIAALCDLLFRAHDLHADGHHDEAAETVAAAAELCKDLAR